MNPEENQLVRFDWAIKNLLRDKANFDVLEGFLTAILSQEVKIVNLLESESNQSDEDKKFNRVDILVRDEKQRYLIIEVQNYHVSAYLERILFGVSKLIADTIKPGNDYSEVSKVISISILYFNLGLGKDYVYHGTTDFRGLHYDESFTSRR
ncbi:MAG TPA: Rpn family recombination-promoting nuclease/putative transposase [Thioploca sp.]|nr:Rpn family recombination-promoting nuclease/putative transposase [Thioploca sp.]